MNSKIKKKDNKNLDNIDKKYTLAMLDQILENIEDDEIGEAILKVKKYIKEKIIR